ncbi:PLP-dependent aminotransferase family protein [Paenibacillus sp. YN15]|uniref:MocR-like pyridoxine biosynthesis transcription factor PdxR n=1 Tax=Paenibacillus sp. YN15 TaxID=1742774 RepID=UPI000DCDD750|nr:PLP-dependent aminotransferase family protein [Paenibacillus sp. YN15]RAV04592.1 PLP-dependent aminotransferase family protein [Paenibacillus sp. YN15]
MDLTPKLDPASGEALYMQLYRSIREDILQGRIPAGARLPSIRRLCGRLNLSRTPVALAYEQLQAEGYVVSKPRSGLFAAELPPAWTAAAASPAVTPAPNLAPTPTFSPTSNLAPAPTLAHTLPLASAPTLASAPASPEASVFSRLTPAEAAEAPPLVDFGYGAVDLKSFPAVRWRRLLNRSLQAEANPILLYGDIQGELGLRKQVVSYLHQTRGVRCLPEQIVIGAGTYHSLDLLLQLLEGEVQILASENYVNTGVKSLFRRFGYSGGSCVPLPLEPDGVSLASLEAAGAQAVYLTPSHQFPYGMILSAAKRLQLLQWAEAHNSYLIENDYDGEFRYGGAPIPSLQSMDRAGRVIYLGTFSRALTPSFRLSYLVLPLPLAQRFKQGEHSYDQLASPLFQETLRLFMESGELERHMRRMRVLYEHKHAVLLEALRTSFGDRLQIIGAGSGLHVLVRLSPGAEETDMIRKAAQRGVKVYPVSVYSLLADKKTEGPVLLGFGGLDTEAIRMGVQLLAQAWLP